MNPSSKPPRTAPGPGLTTAVAAERLENHGPNALPAPVMIPGWWRVLRQLHSPLIYLLLFAFAVGSIGNVFNLSEAWVGALFSVTLFSSAFGGALFGIVSDYIGRVKALTYTIIVYSAFTGLSSFSPNIVFLLACRLILGLGMGGEWASGEVLAKIDGQIAPQNVGQIQLAIFAN